MDKHTELERIKRFYDEDYYADIGSEDAGESGLPLHSRWIAGRLGNMTGQSVLDVACGKGDWLAHLRGKGCMVSGIDLSDKAISHCKRRIRDGNFVCGPAEYLPFEDASFDLVSCLGSLEHFTDKPLALREMLRVAKPDARLLILVPNSGFLTRRLGLYQGTNQAHVREDVLSLQQWDRLFFAAGLQVDARWRDLHVLSPAWIKLGGSFSARVSRTLQALALATWPLSWQYQVYFYCRRVE